MSIERLNSALKTAIENSKKKNPNFHSNDKCLNEKIELIEKNPIKARALDLMEYLKLHNIKFDWTAWISLFNKKL